MDFTLSEEQQVFKESIHHFISKNYQTDILRKMIKGEMDFPADLWGKMAELGWLGTALPEEYGGSGLGFQELVILFEEMGSACLISPLLSNILSSLLILEAGTKEQKEMYLPDLTRGKLQLALAIHEPGFYYEECGLRVKASQDHNGYILNGLKAPVPDGRKADIFIVPARTGERKTTLFIIKSEARGISRTPLNTIAGESQIEIRFDKVSLLSEMVLGTVHEGWPHIEKIISWAALLKSAEMLGGSRRILNICVDYLKVREQFGQPLGSFQAIQHKCAELLTYVDFSRDVVYKPAYMIDQGLACDREIAMSKAWTSEAYRKVVQSTFQLFGAMAYCDEHDMHLYLRHAKSAEIQFGDAPFHRDLIADRLFA
jgi:alkylation response protein AidB-like acyl-CoA dehydrogenase